MQSAQFPDMSARMSRQPNQSTPAIRYRLRFLSENLNALRSIDACPRIP